MAGISQQEHSVESQGVVIAFFIDARHMLHLCNTYPQLEEEMWKRAAVTAAKLSQTQAPLTTAIGRREICALRFKMALCRHPSCVLIEK